MCGFSGDGVCFESQDSMARACGLSVRALRDVIRELEDEGFISVNRRIKSCNKIKLLEKHFQNKE